MDRYLSLFAICLLVCALSSAVLCDSEKSETPEEYNKIRDECSALFEAVGLLGKTRKFKVGYTRYTGTVWDTERMDYLKTVAMLIKKYYLEAVPFNAIKYGKNYIFSDILKRKFLDPCETLTGLGGEMLRSAKEDATEEGYNKMVDFCHKLTPKEQAQEIYKQFNKELKMDSYKIV